MAEAKGYEPSEDEVKSAEQHMSEKEAAMSEAREEVVEAAKKGELPGDRLSLDEAVDKFLTKYPDLVEEDGLDERTMKYLKSHELGQLKEGIDKAFSSNPNVEKIDLRINTDVQKNMDIVKISAVIAKYMLGSHWRVSDSRMGFANQMASFDLFCRKE